MADQAGASLAGRDYFHGNRSIYNFDCFGIYSGIEYLMLKKSRSEEIPFVPFLLIGYLGGIFL